MCLMSALVDEHTGMSLVTWNRAMDKGWSEEKAHLVQRYLIRRKKGIPRLTNGERYWQDRLGIEYPRAKPRRWIAGQEGTFDDMPEQQLLSIIHEGTQNASPARRALHRLYLEQRR